MKLDTQGSLSAIGTPTSYSSAVAGVPTYFTFKAAAGTNLGLALSNLLTPESASYVTLNVTRPDGGQVAYQNCYAQNGGCDVNLPNLAAGMYVVALTPPYDGDRTMSFTATVSADVTAILQTDVAYAMNLPRRGQNGRLTFSGTRGQTVVITTTGQSTVPADQYVYYTAYKPDGTVLLSEYGQGGVALNLALPLTGTYTVLVDPSYGATTMAQATLY